MNMSTLQNDTISKYWKRSTLVAYRILINWAAYIIAIENSGCN